MTHAPTFWSDKLPADRRGEFWGLIDLGFGGETAYCRVTARRDCHNCGGASYTTDGIVAEAVEPRIAETLRYGWRTDAAHGEIEAADEDDALVKLVRDGEWSEPDSPREQRDIADGAWLTIFDADGVPSLRRGTMA